MKKMGFFYVMLIAISLLSGCQARLTAEHLQKNLRKDSSAVTHEWTGYSFLDNSVINSHGLSSEDLQMKIKWFAPPDSLGKQNLIATADIKRQKNTTTAKEDHRSIAEKKETKSSMKQQEQVASNSYKCVKAKNFKFSLLQFIYLAVLLLLAIAIIYKLNRYGHAHHNN